MRCNYFYLSYTRSLSALSALCVFVWLCLSASLVSACFSVSLCHRDTQDTSSDTDSLNSSMGRKQSYTNPCTPGPETPYRKISREELMMLSQQEPQSYVRDSPPPQGGSSAPSPALEHHRHKHKGSPDLTRGSIPESHSMSFATSSAGNKAMYNGILEKSYSMGQLPAGMTGAGVVVVGRNPSLTSLDNEGRGAGGKEKKLQRTSSQDSCDNGDKTKKSSSKIKSLFKKKK